MRKKGIGRYKLEVDIEKGCWVLRNRKSILYLLCLEPDVKRSEVEGVLKRVGWK